MKEARLRELALIRETECIGCTKCIQACPVDAILGSAKKMHTVIEEECIGCKLCLPPCPVDCIDLVVATENQQEAEEAKTRKQRTTQAKKRYLARQKRLQSEEEQQYPSLTELDKRKRYIQQAVTRMKLKKIWGTKR